MNDILEQVYEVYGNDLVNDRSLYSAQSKSPVPVLNINKTFGNWRKFYEAYIAFCMEKRSAVAKKKAVEKKVTKDDKEEE